MCLRLQLHSVELPFPSLRGHFPSYLYIIFRRFHFFNPVRVPHFALLRCIRYPSSLVLNTDTTSFSDILRSFPHIFLLPHHKSYKLSVIQHRLLRLGIFFTIPVILQRTVIKHTPYLGVSRLSSEICTINGRSLFKFSEL